MPDFVLRTTLPAKQHKLKSLPEPAEVLKAVAGSEVELPVLLAMWLGMRLSEIQGLRFEDISPDGVLSITHVRVAVNTHFVEKDTTKTYNSTRQLRVPPEILEKINALPRESETEYIFHFPRGGIYSRFRRLIQKAGLPEMSFHDLRHMNASIMVALGIPDKYAMERGGWSSNGTLQNVYQHTFSEERENVDDRAVSVYLEIAWFFLFCLEWCSAYIISEMLIFQYKNAVPTGFPVSIFHPSASFRPWSGHEKSTSFEMLSF